MCKTMKYSDCVSCAHAGDAEEFPPATNDNLCSGYKYYKDLKCSECGAFQTKKELCPICDENSS